MIDKDKKHDLRPYIQRMNLAEKQELERLGYVVDEKGEIAFKKNQPRVHFLDRFRNTDRSSQWLTATRSKIAGKVLEQANMSRRSFLKLGGSFAAAIPFSESLGLDLRELFPLPIDSPIDAKKAERRETGREIYSQVLEYARAFLVELADERRLRTTIEADQSITDLSALSVSELLEVLRNYFLASDAQTTATEELTNPLRLHYLATSAIQHLFEHPDMSTLTEHYPIESMGQFIQWFGTIFCTGEFFNVLEEIIVDYQSPRGRCIDGQRPDAVIWGNQIPELFVRRFTYFFRSELNDQDNYTDDEIADLESQRLGLFETQRFAFSEDVLKAASIALIKTLAYSDKFCSNAEHRSTETTIGLQDTMNMLHTFEGQSMFGGTTLERIHSMVGITCNAPIDGPALEVSADRILGVYAYSAQKNPDGSIDQSDPGGRAVAFWQQYGRRQPDGNWLVLPEGILTVTISETASQITIAIGGENDESIRNIHNALLSGESFAPSLRSDGLTQETSTIHLNQQNELHLGRMTAQSYSEAFRLQRSRLNFIHSGQNRPDTEPIELSLSQLEWNRMQMRFAEMNQTQLQAALDALREVTPEHEAFQHIHELLLRARPQLESENTHLAVQIYFLLLLRVFEFNTFLTEDSNYSSTDVQQGLQILLGQEAAYPNQVVQYYRTLFSSGLVNENPEDYAPFTITLGATISPTCFPLASLRMQESICRMIANQSAQAGQPKTFFRAIDTFSAIGDIEDHFAQITQFTRFAMQFHLDEKRVVFYLNARNGAFSKYALSDQGVIQLDSVDLTAENYRDEFTEATYFVGRPPKVNP